MRTTLDIDDDVLAAAKDLARLEGKSMGQVISDLARRALTAPSGMAGFAEAQSVFVRDDWPMFPDRGGMPVTSESIKQLEFESELEDGIAWDHVRDAPRVFTKSASDSGTPKSRKPRAR